MPHYFGIHLVFFRILSSWSGGRKITLGFRNAQKALLSNNEARNTKSTLIIEYEQSLYLNACPVKGGKRGNKRNSNA